MLIFTVRRLIASIWVMLGISVLVFLILRLIPGDPAYILLQGANATPEQVEQFRASLGLDRPLIVQYFSFLGGLIQGDLGYSYITRTPVLDEILARLPYTLTLALGSALVAVVFGLLMGFIGGARPGSVADKIAVGFAVLGVAVPYFWLAQLLIIIFAVQLGWFPSLGFGGFHALILPWLSLGISYAAVFARMLRASLIEVQTHPYMLVARAKGLNKTQLLFGHATRNAMVSVVTIAGLQFAALVAGTVVTEIIFGRPGIGSFLVASISTGDITSVQGVVLVIAVFYVVINLIVDVLHGVIDPRVRQNWSAS